MKNTIVSDSRDLKAYFRDRLEYKINLYDRKAFEQKYFYLSVASLAMVSAAVVPVLIASKCEVWATSISLVVTILVGIQSIFHPREHWRNYDMIAAMLRREEMLFSTKSGIYQEEEYTERLQLLVSRVEDLIANERKETIVMRTSASEQKTPPATDAPV